ncbi:MAG TPA: hypothetical protein VMY88_11430 [Acidimicrobiales bacterium]|nr:hypothetical protein [Acidimicrobiales bacterium]
MKRRVGLAVAAALVAAIGLSPPGQAEPNAKFEATITAPAHDVNEELFADACPGGGDYNGLTYAFFDIKGEYKHFKSYGPPHLFNQPEPVAVYHDINDYDIDMYAFDAKCKDVTPASANGPAGTERFETKRPARYILIAYWSGIHTDLPVTLEVSHTKIK